MSHSICKNIKQIEQEIGNTQLVVVSKYRSLPELQEVYDGGHRHYGENRVQELTTKYENLPKDIHWHLIGHLQSNKVKYIAPFIYLIHSIDSLKLLKEVDKEARKHQRVISFLFQMHIAQEETKFGLSKTELDEILLDPEYINLTHVACKGLMGMASYTEDIDQVKKEFEYLNSVYTELKDKHHYDTLSMGMSGDYLTAIAEGSNLIRVGSKIFSV
ncbi:MAG TPA: YggS family pyridoxal phosphate-dependent enzyme [Bacteroidetes bacterium]|nr:YggS family pyridoxal phosphate-dependent enzyme [Bacteroidota bacterium]